MMHRELYFINTPPLRVSSPKTSSITHPHVVPNPQDFQNANQVLFDEINEDSPLTATTLMVQKVHKIVKLIHMN